MISRRGFLRIAFGIGSLAGVSRWPWPNSFAGDRAATEIAGNDVIDCDFARFQEKILMSVADGFRVDYEDLVRDWRKTT